MGNSHSIKYHLSCLNQHPKHWLVRTTQNQLTNAMPFCDQLPHHVTSPATLRVWAKHNPTLTHEQLVLWQSQLRIVATCIHSSTGLRQWSKSRTHSDAGSWDMLTANDVTTPGPRPPDSISAIAHATLLNLQIHAFSASGKTRRYGSSTTTRTDSRKHTSTRYTPSRHS
ncbi:hypothetical protein BJ546DRAFT_201477 [Cryomyces antarcticus]